MNLRNSSCLVTESYLGFLISFTVKCFENTNSLFFLADGPSTLSPPSTVVWLQSYHFPGVPLANVTKDTVVSSEFDSSRGLILVAYSFLWNSFHAFHLSISLGSPPKLLLMYLFTLWLFSAFTKELVFFIPTSLLIYIISSVIPFIFLTCLPTAFLYHQIWPHSPVSYLYVQKLLKSMFPLGWAFSTYLSPIYSKFRSMPILKICTLSSLPISSDRNTISDT